MNEGNFTSRNSPNNNICCIPCFFQWLRDAHSIDDRWWWMNANTGHWWNDDWQAKAAVRGHEKCYSHRKWYSEINSSFRSETVVRGQKKWYSDRNRGIRTETMVLGQIHWHSDRNHGTRTGTVVLGQIHRHSDRNRGTRTQTAVLGEKHLTAPTPLRYILCGLPQDTTRPAQIRNRSST